MQPVDRIRRKFQQEVNPRRRAFSPLRAALYLAQTLEPDLPPERAESILQGWAESIRSRLAESEEPYQKFLVFNRFFFQELGFHRAPEGSPGIAYIDPHRVLASRSGWPVTIALLYQDLSTRLGVPLQTMGFPGQLLFTSAWLPRGGFIDPGDGEILGFEEARHRVELFFSGRQVLLKPEQLTILSDRQLLERYLVTLKGVYLAGRQRAEALQVTDWRLLLSPRSAQAHRERGLILYELNRFEEAHRDLRGLLLRSAAERSNPRHVARARVCALLAYMEKSLSSK